MPEPVVDPPVVTDPPAPVVTEPAGDAKALQAEIDRLKAEKSEQETATRYWYEQAKGKQPAKVEPPPTENEEDPLELLSKKGGKGLDELLEKRGYLRADQVDAKIETRARVIATENELAAKYPDLKDNKSEFFKETAKHYQELISQGTPAHVAMKLAAKAAALDGYESGKRLSKDDKEEREARAKAQGGGKETSAAKPDPDDDEKLTAEQKMFCEKFGISEEAYIKRAKAGVTVGGTK